MRKRSIAPRHDSEGSSASGGRQRAARRHADVLLFRLGRDAMLGPVRRVAARVLSFYQRAPIHILSEAGWGDFDWMLSSLLRWLLLRLCARRARHWRGEDAVTLPSSRWAGSLFVVAVWAGLVLAVNRLPPVLPNAVTG